MLKVNNKNTRTTSLKLKVLEFTIKTLEHDVNFEQINAGWAHSVKAIDHVEF